MLNGKLIAHTEGISVVIEVCVGLKLPRTCCPVAPVSKVALPPPMLCAAWLRLLLASPCPSSDGLTLSTRRAIPQGSWVLQPNLRWHLDNGPNALHASRSPQACLVGDFCDALRRCLAVCWAWLLSWLPAYSPRSNRRQRNGGPANPCAWDAIGAMCAREVSRATMVRELNLANAQATSCCATRCCASSRKCRVPTAVHLCSSAGSSNPGTPYVTG